MIEPHLVEERLRSGVDGLTHLSLRDLTGTKDHYEATIVASAFDGLSRVARHQLVYRTLGDWMQGPVHALTMTTLTPAEWAARGGA